MRILETSSGQGHSHPRMVRDTSSSQDASTHQIWDSYQDTIILKTRSGQGHSDPKMVHHTLPSQGASTNQIWDSYLKEYVMRYAPDTKRDGWTV